MDDLSGINEDYTPTFVVVWESTIGRQKEDGSHHEPVNLSFITTVRAADKEAAQDQLLVYSDPTFVLKVERIAQLGEDMSQEELVALLEHKKVFNVLEVQGKHVQADRGLVSK